MTATLEIKGILFPLAWQYDETDQTFTVSTSYKGEKVSAYGDDYVSAMRDLRESLMLIVKKPAKHGRLTPQQYRIVESDPTGQFDWWE